MKILGISCFYHDSAAALVDNGRIINCVQEERFSRKKHDSNFPSNSIKFILEENKINLNDINYIVFYEKPFIKFERLIETYLHYVPKGFGSFKNALPIWIKEKLFQKVIIRDLLKDIDKSYKKKNIFSQNIITAMLLAHFFRHLLKSFSSNFRWCWRMGNNKRIFGGKNKLKPLKVINYPNSLGLLYSAFYIFLWF